MRWSSFLLSNLFWMSHELPQLKFRLPYYILEFRYILVIKVVHIEYKAVEGVTGFGARGDFPVHLFQITTLKR